MFTIYRSRSRRFVIDVSQCKKKLNKAPFIDTTHALQIRASNTITYYLPVPGTGVTNELMSIAPIFKSAGVKSNDDAVISSQVFSNPV